MNSEGSESLFVLRGFIFQDFSNHEITNYYLFNAKAQKKLKSICL